jgi:hypothetical protein
MKPALEYILNKYNLKHTKKLPIEIPDTNRVTLAQLFSELEYKVGAEIGVEQGLYSKQLCESNPGLKLYCVDAWKAYSGYRDHVSQEKIDSFYEISKQRLVAYDAHLIRKFSVDASKDFEDNSLDFVYIDGNHEFSHVSADICAWVPKVKNGGIVAGHDYIRRKNKDYQMHVVDVVNAYTSAMQINHWFVLGSKDKKPGELRDDARSWFFVKGSNE